MTLTLKTYRHRMLHSDSATVGGAGLESGTQIESWEMSLGCRWRWEGRRGEGRRAGWGVQAWSAARAAKASFWAPWSSFCRRESVYLCVPLGGGGRGYAYVQRGGGVIGGRAQRARQELRVNLDACYVPVRVVWSHISSSSPVIIPDCVCWGLPRSQRNSRQSGLLPKSAESCPVSRDWVKEEQHETFNGPGIKLDKLMTAK